MQWNDLDLRPTDRKLREFSAICILASLALIVWSLRRSEAPALLLGLALVLILTGLVGLGLPRFVRPLYAGLLVATFPIGWTVSRLVLAVVYYLVVTPIGVLRRIGKHDPLSLLGRGRDSHWKTTARVRTPESYLRQF